MPCLDAVLKACRRGADKHGRVAALLKQEQQQQQQRKFISGFRDRSNAHQSSSWSPERSFGYLHQWIGVSQKRLLFVNAAVPRHQVVAMSEVDKAKEAAASGYVYLLVSMMMDSYICTAMLSAGQ